MRRFYSRDNWNWGSQKISWKKELSSATVKMKDVHQLACSERVKNISKQLDQQSAHPCKPSHFVLTALCIV